MGMPHGEVYVRHLIGPYLKGNSYSSAYNFIQLIRMYEIFDKIYDAKMRYN